MKLFTIMAGGALLTAIAAPYIAKKGVQVIRDTLHKYEFDPQTGSIRYKDEGVIVLEEHEYEIQEHEN